MTEPLRLARRRYRFLDVTVDVQAASDDVPSLLDAVFDGFRDGGEAPPDLEATRAVDGAGAPILRLEGRELPLAPPPLTAFHAYTLIFAAVLDRLDRVFFLHGAAVTDGVRTLVLAGPSGHGKTTLALALAGRGWRLLSDDFAPLRRRDGHIEPFAKRIGVARRPGDARPAGGAGVVGDKWLLDPGSLPAGAERTARRLTHVLLLGARSHPAHDARFRLATAGDPAPLRHALEAIEGVELAAGRTPGGPPAIEVRVRGRARAAFHACCADARRELVLLEPLRDGTLFGTVPAVRPLPHLEAATGLMEEMLNRAPGSALWNEAGGRPGVLLVELAGLLEGVACARLQVGPPEATAAAIAAWAGEDRA
jgi:hypothetical protein